MIIAALLALTVQTPTLEDVYFKLADAAYTEGRCANHFTSTEQERALTIWNGVHPRLEEMYRRGRAQIADEPLPLGVCADATEEVSRELDTLTAQLRALQRAN
jgi:hypothetical protein